MQQALAGGLPGAAFQKGLSERRTYEIMESLGAAEDDFAWAGYLRGSVPKDVEFKVSWRPVKTLLKREAPFAHGLFGDRQGVSRATPVSVRWRELAPDYRFNLIARDLAVAADSVIVIAGLNLR